MPPIFTLELTRVEYLFTTITVFESGRPGGIEFRGDGIWQWGLGVPECSTEDYRARRPWIRSHGTRICWAEWLHDGGLEGWHTCVMHAGDRLAILPHHPDYEFVRRLVAYSEMREADVLKLLEEEDAIPI